MLSSLIDISHSHSVPQTRAIPWPGAGNIPSRYRSGGVPAWGWSQWTATSAGVEGMPGRQLPHLRKPTKNWWGSKEFVSPSNQRCNDGQNSSCNFTCEPEWSTSTRYSALSHAGLVGWKKPPIFGKKTMKNHILHGFPHVFPHGFSHPQRLS